MNKRIQALKGQRGFTLIELLVVIVVIGILIGLAVPAVMSFLERGRDADRKADLGSLQTPLEEHYGDNGFYPDVAYADLADHINVEGDMPQDPQEGDYEYIASGCDGDEAQGFALAAALENEDDPDGEDGLDWQGLDDDDTWYVLTSTQSAFDDTDHCGAA